MTVRVKFKLLIFCAIEVAYILCQSFARYPTHRIVLTFIFVKKGDQNDTTNQMPFQFSPNANNRYCINKYKRTSGIFKNHTLVDCASETCTLSSLSFSFFFSQYILHCLWHAFHLFKFFYALNYFLFYPFDMLFISIWSIVYWILIHK